MSDTIRDAFAAQARACAELGSPFTAALLAALPERLDPATRFGARILHWPGDPRADALALRAAGALHALARSGPDPALTAAWPPAPAPAPAGAAAAAIARHDAWLTPWLDGPPQTNEVARAAALLGGLSILAADWGRPLELLEIGASAGLNTILDRFRIEAGPGLSRGDPASPVRIDTAWTGPAPPDLTPEIAARAASDIAPLDPGEPQARARLAAYVWPDQPARLARLEAALDLAARLPWRVARADAGDWLAGRLARPPAAGAGRVVMHSVVRQYLPPATAAAMDAALARAGADATPQAPLAWLRLEPGGDNPGAALSLTQWPGGETRELARSDFHGRWTAWTGA